MDRSRQVAALITALPDGVGALLTREWERAQLECLSSALLEHCACDGREMRRAVQSFGLELQAATGVRLASLARRDLSELCRQHPVEAGALLGRWLQMEGLKVEPPAPAAGEDWESLADELARLDWTQLKLTPLEVACILVMSPEPAVSAQIFKDLGADWVHTLTLAICDLSKETHTMAPQLLADQARHFEPFTQLAARSPEGAATCLERLLKVTPAWDRPLSASWTRSELSSASHTAVLLEDLEPGLVEQFLQSLASERAHDIQLARKVLCPAEAGLKSQIVEDFSKCFGPYDLLAQDHATMLKCLDRIGRVTRPPSAEVSKLEGNWSGLRVYYGDLLREFFKDPAVRTALTGQIGELQGAWQRTPLEFLLCHSHALSGFQVVVRFKTQLLEKFELPPESERLPVFLRHTLAAQAQRAPHLRVRKAEGPSLPQRGLAALAVIRSFPANLLTHGLTSLEQPQLGQVAESLAELLALSSDKMSECIRDSCLVSPSELMQLAGLEREENCARGSRMLQVALLVTLSGAPAEITRVLLPRVGHRTAVELTEKMIRLFYRWEERPLTVVEAIPAGFSFLQWRGRNPLGVCSRGAGSEELAGSIMRLWPHLTQAYLEQVLLVEFPADPERAARQLEDYLEQGPQAPPWVPGPLLAAQFMHGLQSPEPVRQELWARGYPIPCLPVELELLERAQREWNRAVSIRP